ncbi:hypothetical protein DEO72_LG9g1850 [Vigna unguiculata]|uniref:TF-B3 domain-containing protein n=1 Tax=Vigna unguiculata TaxID=3917 RepID=A0A4D6MZE5_VIGUN|nr:hypothetical protein DEO72_LG9g1850 [Vigna unguiculata]
MASSSGNCSRNFHPFWMSILNPDKTNEIDYPIPKKSNPFLKPHKSVKFFTCFSVYLLVKLFRIFTFTGDEIIYSQPPTVNDDARNVESDDENSFYYSMEKTLTEYDVKCSSLYLDAQFALVALVRDKKNHYLRNFFGWSLKCTIRWTKRRSSECYLTCGWKYFCWENGFKAGDVIRFGVNKQRSTTINVVKV